MSARSTNYIREQTMKFRKGRIGRRAFISSMLSAGVTVPTAMGMASQVLAETPQQGGHLRISVETSPGRTGAPTDFDGMAAFLSANALTEISASGQIRGDLADSVTANEDATRWIFRLRRDVQFHNGKGFGCDDVVATFEHLAKLRHPPELLKYIQSVREAGPNTVAFALRQPVPDFARRIADPRFVLRPANAPEDSLTGTGPYRVTHVAASGAIEAEKNV